MCRDCERLIQLLMAKGELPPWQVDEFLNVDTNVEFMRRVKKIENIFASLER